MTISNKNLDQFITNYFSLNDCEVVHKNDGVFDIQLTEKMDKVLMNRPFYWHYIKSTGSKGDPMKLTIITDPNKKDQEGEWVHFGSPRLQQIFTHLKQSKYTKLFQEIDTVKQTPLFPWLIINIKIKYIGKLTKEELFSIGLNLVNGMMKVNMMELIKNEAFHLNVSDYCYPISPIIKISNGFKRVEAILDQYIENQSHHWAVDSLNEIAKEKELLHYFYQEDTNNEQLTKQLKEITLRYTPTIIYEVINGGLFYLEKNLFTNAKAR